MANPAKLSSSRAQAILSLELWYSTILSQAACTRLQTPFLEVADAERIRLPILKKRVHETSNSLGAVNPDPSPPKPTNQPEKVHTLETPHELGFKRSLISGHQSSPDLSKSVPGCWRRVNPPARSINSNSSQQANCVTELLGPKTVKCLSL